MLRSISRNHILIGLPWLFIFLGFLYIYRGPSISPLYGSDTNIIETKSKPLNGPLNKGVCSDNGSWRVGDLKMQTGLKYAQPSTQNGRTDVNSVTNWNAPLVWEGTFDPVVIDAIYKKMDPRVAVVLFAVGKYTRFLKGFLESAEKYFLVGFRVTYYIFTDNKGDVPTIKLGKGRKISVVTIPSVNRWQEVVLGRMKWATITIDKQNTRRDQFPYERRPKSMAYIPADEGDYYYTAAVWGGYLEDMYRLVKYCYTQSEEDAKNGIEAVWQEESHLNKYLLYNKPTKVLSPEYLWSDYDKIPADIKVVRISQLVKNYEEVRPNGGH
ncbi:globoside alpha-1,3-N-acetylgalactosaminyltransferase 1 isoform X2 [Gasterosteus aculeatus]